MPLPDFSQQLLAQFDESAAIHEEFKDYLVATIGSLLFDGKVKCHAISGRVKSRESLLGKLTRGKTIYASLQEVTDIAGIRVTTYFAKDVDAVGAILKPMFQIDLKNSVDKRALLDPDRFGYVSLHFVISVREDTGVHAASRFVGLKAEIQIRSILQHAWAEIEHDLGYKGSVGVPRHIKRQFARVAGVLEIADKEFDELREEIQKYKEGLKEQIEFSSKELTIDSNSLAEYLRSDADLAALDNAVSRLVGVSISGAVPVERLLRVLRTLSIRKIDELKLLLEQHQDQITSFAAEWFDRGYSGHVVAAARGSALLFFFYVQISSGHDVSRIINALRDSGLSDKLVGQTAEKIAQVAQAL